MYNNLFPILVSAVRSVLRVPLYATDAVQAQRICQYTNTDIFILIGKVDHEADTTFTTTRLSHYRYQNGEAAAQMQKIEKIWAKIVAARKARNSCMLR